MQCPSISYGNKFFLKRRDYYAFIAKKKKQQISSKILNGPRFN
jgi:hypothetical protein